MGWLNKDILPPSKLKDENFEHTCKEGTLNKRIAALRNEKDMLNDHQQKTHRNNDISTKNYHNYLKKAYNDESFDFPGSNNEIFTITSNQVAQPMSWPSPSPVSQAIKTNAQNLCNEGHKASPISDNYTNLPHSNDFHYITTMASKSGSNSFNKNDSTAELLPFKDDKTNKQSKCSIFRGLVLCLCLNATFGNIVRFPRELERNGTAFLVPYYIILFLVGLPVILLEFTIGQFLGQGSAHTYRVAPIFKGAFVLGRISSWLGAIWTALDAILAILYVGTLTTSPIPFNECVVDVSIPEIGYIKSGRNGQDCLQRTFLTPPWDDLFYFAVLSIGLLVLWTMTALGTHSESFFRRIIFWFGLLGSSLLIALTIFETYKALKSQYFPAMWPFSVQPLLNSSLWFDALVQVIYSTNIGFGVLPVITGKFMYKGDAVKTSIIYLCFNLLINALAVTLFIVPYDNYVTKNSTILFPELKIFTSIYDSSLVEQGLAMTRILPVLIYILIIISALVSMIIAIYTSSRMIPRHPNFIISLVALLCSLISLLSPKYFVANILDARIVGAIAIFGMAFDKIATTWIYGFKSIYTDLEFSVGRPICKLWLAFSAISPIILISILLWWTVTEDDLIDIFYNLPKWSTIIVSILIIFIFACFEISKQVDYNFFGMICEAAKPAKDWGPGDPLARHAWKQWCSVCNDTGRRDFTLRRRGTRDYTRSIKRGQYNNTNKYGTPNCKSSTPGNSSPNYSGSVFGDSAIEEDMSVGKYSEDNQNFTVFNLSKDTNKPLRYSNRSRKYPLDKRRQFAHDYQKEILYARHSSIDGSNNTTKIQISPSNGKVNIPIVPVANYSIVRDKHDSIVNSLRNQSTTEENGEHICWKNFSIKSEEFSTEL